MDISSMSVEELQKALEAAQAAKSQDKPAESKPDESKPDESKPAEVVQTTEAKPAEVKPAEVVKDSAPADVPGAKPLQAVAPNEPVQSTDAVVELTAQIHAIQAQLAEAPDSVKAGDLVVLNDSITRIQKALVATLSILQVFNYIEVTDRQQRFESIQKLVMGN